jgi:hypothetical protein
MKFSFLVSEFSRIRVLNLFLYVIIVYFFVPFVPSWFFSEEGLSTWKFIFCVCFFYFIGVLVSFSVHSRVLNIRKQVWQAKKIQQVLFMQVYYNWCVLYLALTCAEYQTSIHSHWEDVHKLKIDNRQEAGKLVTYLTPVILLILSIINTISCP